MNAELDGLKAKTKSIWFDGYSSTISESPSAQQKEKVGSLNEAIFQIIDSQIPLEKVEVIIEDGYSEKTSMSLEEFMRNPECFYKEKIAIMTYCVLRKFFKVNGGESFGVDYLLYTQETAEKPKKTLIDFEVDEEAEEQAKEEKRNEGKLKEDQLDLGEEFKEGEEEMKEYCENDNISKREEDHSKHALKLVPNESSGKEFPFQRIYRLTRIAFNAKKTLLLASPVFFDWDFPMFFEKFPELNLDDLKIIEFRPTKNIK